MSKKTFAVMGMIISAVIVLMGLLVLTGAMGGDVDYPSSLPYYDSGYASFGADFYTYVTNNAAEAASSAHATARNVMEMSNMLRAACGISMMGFGLLALCYFGIQKCSICEPVECVCKEEEPVAETEETSNETEEVSEAEAVPQEEEIL